MCIAAELLVALRQRNTLLRGGGSSATRACSQFSVVKIGVAPPSLGHGLAHATGVGVHLTDLYDLQ